jgi:hypothetical protein
MPSLRQIRLATGLVPPRASGGRRSEWTGSKASSLRLLPHANRSLMNRDALGSAQPTPLAEDRFSRFSPVHRADFEGQQRADSAPTGVASGGSAVGAKAAIPLRARNKLNGPKQASIEALAHHREGWIAVVREVVRERGVGGKLGLAFVRERMLGGLAGKMRLVPAQSRNDERKRCAV